VRSSGAWSSLKVLCLVSLAAQSQWVQSGAPMGNWTCRRWSCRTGLSRLLEAKNAPYFGGRGPRTSIDTEFVDLGPVEA
jgi:hypothetical protein